MSGLYIGSTSGYSGKNMIISGLGLKFISEGLKVGYMKPVGAVPREIKGKMGDDDAFFIQEILGQNLEPSLVTPVVVTHDFKVRAFEGNYGNLLPDIKKAYAEISKDRDVTLIAGSGSMYSGKYCKVDGITLVKELGVKAIVIDRFVKELDYDYLLAVREALGDAMIGAILNDIPHNLIDEVQNVLAPFLEKSGVKVLGILRRDKLMSSITVGELAERMGGKVISAHDKTDRSVESFLIGTMQVENFMTHFRKNKSAAIIVGGDRSDVQLVALEGECPCLVLTGNLYPNDIILTRAEVLEIPIILVREDTFSIAQKMDNILTRSKMRDRKKVQQGAQLVVSNIDVSYIRTKLGLEGS